MTVPLSPDHPGAKAEIRIWLDDLRPAPEGYIWCRSVNEAKRLIGSLGADRKITVIDCDHDLGDYASDGGDGIKLLDWLVLSHCPAHDEPGRPGKYAQADQPLLEITQTEEQ